MIVLINENHDLWPNVKPDQQVLQWFYHSNLVSLFRGSKFFYQKFDEKNFSNFGFFFQIWAHKTLCLQR